MKEPELLELISEIAKEQDEAAREKDAQGWDLYAQGKLDDEALEALMNEDGKEDPELLKELYRPIEDDRVDALVDAVLAELPPEEQPPVASPEEAAPGLLNFFRLWQLIPVGAAAAFLFTLSTSPLPVPDYQLEIAGQSALVRGDATDGGMKFNAGNRMVMTLRPETPAESDVYAAASLKLDNGSLIPIDARVEVSATGAIQLTWTVEWNEELGNVTALVVVVSTKSSTLKEPLKTLQRNSDVKVFEKPLTIISEP